VQTKALSYKTNEQIKYTEVRLVGEVGDEGKSSEMMDVNEVMLTQDALVRAMSRGLDLVLVNEERDPPLVKIVDVSKYAYMERRKEKEKMRQGKQPKLKEVKISYTIGDHDLNSKLNKVSKWLENKRQQVRICVVMKGRSRMFEKQAKELLERIRAEVAPYAKAAGSVKSSDAITKDGSGNLFMMLSSGADMKLLKELQEAQADEEEDGRDEDDPVVWRPRSAAAEVSEELAELMAELDEVRQDLLDCGIAPGQLNKQPEFIDVMQQIEKVKAKTASGAFGSQGRTAAGVLCAAGFALATAASLAALPRRPRLPQARRRSLW